MRELGDEANTMEIDIKLLIVHAILLKLTL